MNIKDIPLGSIVAGKNYRQDLALDEDFIASIKANGILEPLIVSPVAKQKGKYDLIAGGRRLAAAKKLRLKTAPCSVREKLTEAERLAMGVVENTQRRATSPLEDADAIAKLFAEGWDADAIAKKLGRSSSYVVKMRELCSLGAVARSELVANNLTVAVAIMIARLHLEPEDEARVVGVLAGNTERAPYTVARATDFIESTVMLRLKYSGFSMSDGFKEIPEVGPCTKCPHRSGAQRALFDDVAAKDICLSPECFHLKQDMVWGRCRTAAPDRCVDVNFDTFGTLITFQYVDLGAVSDDGKQTWEQKLKPKADEVFFARDGRGGTHRLAKRPKVKSAPAETLESVPDEKPAATGKDDAKAKKQKGEAIATLKANREKALDLLDRAIADIDFDAGTIAWFARQAVRIVARPALISFLEVEGNIEDKEIRTMNDAALRDAVSDIFERTIAHSSASATFTLLVELEAHTHLSMMSVLEPEVPSFIDELYKHVSAG